MDPLSAEVRKLASLALPVVAAQVGTMMLGVVDAIMLGHYAVDALAAAALAIVWVFGTLMAFMGVVLGMDPIIAQAPGAGDGELAGRTVQHGVVLALVLSLPVALLWAFTGDFLLLAGQEPELAAAAHRYTVVQIPTLWTFLLFAAVRSYLQGRELMRPAMWAMVLANLLNVVFNWAFIFGRFGAPELGLVGAGLATALTRLVSVSGLLAWVWIFSLHRGAWVPWSRDAFRWRPLKRIVAMGVPVSLQMSLEIWAFSGAALIAGWIGATSVAAHTITLNMAALSFMIPLGISQGAVTRVGNLIGMGRYEAAQRATWIAITLGAGVMALAALVFVSFRHGLPRLFTDDAAVVALSASILPIAAAFQVFDGTQVVGCGVLRGMGRTRPAAWFNLVAYWVLGLPVGYLLAIPLARGLAGIWWGLCLGLAVVAGLLLLWLRRRGPAALAPHAAVSSAASP